MIQKLQRRFILITGLAVVIMLLCFLLPVNAINRYRVSKQLRETLSIIIDSDGYISYNDETESEDTDGTLSSLWGSLFGDDTVNLTPESRYQLRYFLVWFDGNGDIDRLSLSHIAAVDEDTARDLARDVYDGLLNHGYTRSQSVSYYFLREHKSGGATVVGFLDCDREQNNLASFYYTSFGLAFLMVVVLLIVIAFLSKKAMMPFIRNIESQREFITNAGHELKTPFAIISANTEVLEMLNGKNEWTDSILAQVKRGTSLINELITLSRTAESAEVVLTDVNMSDITAESAQSFRPVIEQKEKKLECSIEENLHIKGDQKMLSELVNILVDNAAKYCDDGGTVNVILKKRGRSGVMLAVSNNFRDGSEEECSRYFRRFYRGDQSHNSKMSGYGIGLSMAQSVTERLKGKIAAHWKRGVITFTVVF